MQYNRVVTLKSGERCRLRSAEESDAQAVLDVFNQTHRETDYMLTDPDENTFDAAQEARFLKAQAESANEIEIVAEVDGEIAGTAGIEAVGGKYKLRRRAGDRAVRAAGRRPNTAGIPAASSPARRGIRRLRICGWSCEEDAVI